MTDAAQDYLDTEAFDAAERFAIREAQDKREYCLMSRAAWEDEVFQASMRAKRDRNLRQAFGLPSDLSPAPLVNPPKEPSVSPYSLAQYIYQYERTSPTGTSACPNLGTYTIGTGDIHVDTGGIANYISDSAIHPTLKRVGTGEIAGNTTGLTLL